MADFTKNSVADMAAANPGLNMGTSGSMRDTDYYSDELWAQHDAHWREHYATRPYARTDRSYEHYQPAYRYGHGSAVRHQGREWTEVERDLEHGWESAHGTTGSTWHEAKDAVRDAWDRTRSHR